MHKIKDKDTEAIKMKRLVLNKKGMFLLLSLTTTSMILGVYDTPDIILFNITKIISIIFGMVSIYMSKYIPKKYL